MAPVNGELRERRGDLISLAVLAVLVTGLTSFVMTFLAGVGCAGDQGGGRLCGEQGQPLTFLLAFGPPVCMVAMSALAIRQRSQRLLIGSALVILVLALVLPVLLGD